MELSRFLRTAICATALLPAVTFAADQGGGPPASNLVVLPCDGKCATITRNPRKVNGADVPLPQQGPPSGTRFINNTNGDGYLELQYTILPDGHVADDISVLRLLGGPEFAEAAKRTIRNWIYEPATVDGEPVAIAHKLIVFFNASGSNGARSSVTTTYNDASALMKAGKLDEARAKLRETFKLPQLNFYERGVVSYLLAVIAMQRNDFVEARLESDLALTLGFNALSRAMTITMYRYNILAALQLGDIAGATKYLDAFKNHPFFDPNEPLIKATDDMRKKLDALPVYGINGRIPETESADGFSVWVYRRHFAFANVSGKLNGFQISCRERETTSPFSEKAEWRIPANWSDCSLLVKGTPGTTFQIVQFAAPPPSP